MDHYSPNPYLGFAGSATSDCALPHSHCLSAAERAFQMCTTKLLSARHALPCVPVQTRAPAWFFFVCLFVRVSVCVGHRRPQAPPIFPADPGFLVPLMAPHPDPKRESVSERDRGKRPRGSRKTQMAAAAAAAASCCLFPEEAAELAGSLLDQVAFLTGQTPVPSVTAVADCCPTRKPNRGATWVARSSAPSPACRPAIGGGPKAGVALSERGLSHSPPPPPPPLPPPPPPLSPFPPQTRT
ncbi:MAG: hypothetical protein BJ554DRAFT_5961 [Olpidium bornovanus]|uniref:Uncharacterized protein n=1 Tax=Olpidium bornovanus TaxID=278681 RepID=A0A8H7ZYR1_9FUNG|nr:MAG: hypothetical protein BJ554DRAFT_5961 [Olpidium bornovanus]